MDLFLGYKPCKRTPLVQIQPNAGVGPDPYSAFELDLYVDLGLIGCGDQLWIELPSKARVLLQIMTCSRSGKNCCENCCQEWDQPFR